MLLSHAAHHDRCAGLCHDRGAGRSCVDRPQRDYRERRGEDGRPGQRCRDQQEARVKRRERRKAEREHARQSCPMQTSWTAGTRRRSWPARAGSLPVLRPSTAATIGAIFSSTVADQIGFNVAVPCVPAAWFRPDRVQKQEHQAPSRSGSRTVAMIPSSSRSPQVPTRSSPRSRRPTRSSSASFRGRPADRRRSSIH